MVFYARLILAPIAYLLLAAALGALAAYPVSLMTDGWMPFHKWVSRLSLVFLVLGAWPLYLRLGLGARGMGLPRWRDVPRHFVKGFGYGLIILAVNLALLFALDVRVFDPEMPLSLADFCKAAAKALATGVIVALIEEPLFRGVLLGGLRKYAANSFAIAVSAFYYAALHFVRSPSGADRDITWLSGFRVVADAFANLTDAIHFDSFLALFAVGAFLGCVRVHPKLGLGYCVGLHASWVFLIKTTKRVSDLNPRPPWPHFAGEYDGIIGYPTVILLLALAIPLWIHVVKSRLVGPSGPR